MILEGWRDAIWTHQYAAVQYDCASAAVAARIRRIATKAGLSPPEFIAAAQRTAEEIRSITPDPIVDKPAPVPLASAPEPEGGPDGRSSGRQLRLASAAAPAPMISEAPPPPPEPEESPEAAAERERRYREIFGIPEPKPRRHGVDDEPAYTPGPLATGLLRPRRERPLGSADRRRVCEQQNAPR